MGTASSATSIAHPAAPHGTFAERLNSRVARARPAGLHG